MASQQDILNNINTGVIALDSRLQLSFINASAQALLEASRARVQNQHISLLVMNPDELLATLQQSIDAHTALAQRGMALLLHSGKLIHIDLFASPITAEGAAPGLLLELQRVDRLQRISRKEGMQQAQDTTRTVIRGLAHEIKNPLGGVRGAAQLLARELPDSSLCEYTDIIIREADRLRDLVDRLLGPNQQLEFAALNVHEILEQVRQLLNAETNKQITITRDYDPSLPELWADRSQLVQAVLNIMRNALQAARSLSDCHITLRTRSQRQFTIGAQRHRLVCRVDIIDNGPGIPEELQGLIFVPMVTGRAKGTGLGLSIAQSIINRHGGLLECQSEPGHTQFTIYLPLDHRNDTTR